MRIRTSSAIPICVASIASLALWQPAKADKSFVELIDVPAIESMQRTEEPVVIAIVDDGVRISHQDIEAFVWTNEQEVPGNGIDDDGNGFVDDVHGWDVADQKNVVTPPNYRSDYYHGTHIAGIVAQIARVAYGGDASSRVRIMPVKAIADDDPTGAVRRGFDGIAYATEAGADIIITSWVVAQISADEERILDRATAAGVLIVASSGNFPEERENYPAAHKNVVAVGSTGHDGKKVEQSNYGQYVDISAPGSSVRSAGIDSDDSYNARDGTSFSAAMVAAAAALVKLQHPSLSPKEVEACLISSSKPIPVSRKEFKGKVGAGLLDVRAAMTCDSLLAESADVNALNSPKGFLRANRKRGASISWVIEPDGEFKGIRFNPVNDRKNSTDGRIEFRNAPTPDGKILSSYTLDNLPESIFVSGSRAFVSFEPRKKRKRVDWLIEYEVETIDFSTIHCSGTQNIQTEGMLTDGSGAEEYSANTDCKWLITAPPGKVVQFVFDEIDTEPRTDMIYFFNGSGTHEQIMAIFSGQELPPELSTWSNQVLVWFVANGQNQGRGWQANYRFVDQRQ